MRYSKVVFTRLLSLLLALIITGPNCWCRESDAKRTSSAVEHSCCHSAANTKQAPFETGKSEAPCSCNKCLSKRNLANAPVQAPALTWSFVTPLSAIWEHATVTTETVTPRFPMDTGPPHERQAIFARYCALLL